MNSLFFQNTNTTKLSIPIELDNCKLQLIDFTQYDIILGLYPHISDTELLKLLGNLRGDKNVFR